jgi:hypothetical protein
VGRAPVGTLRLSARLRPFWGAADFLACDRELRDEFGV